MFLIVLFSGKYQNIIPEETYITAASKHAGLFNKGGTCYSNSILEDISVLLSFYTHKSSKHDKIISLCRLVNLNMTLLKAKTNPIDPSRPLWAVINKTSKDRDTPFNFNSQKDVTEIL